MSTRAFGKKINRNIDPKLLKGEGSFVDDIPLHGALHVAFVRSPFARAKILSMDTSLAENHHGVIGVYTSENIGPLDIELPLLIPHDCMKNARTQRPLAKGDVYYVGQTVAMIVAIDRYVAEDAALLVDVEYEVKEVELDLEKAIKNDAPLVHSTHPNNIAADLTQVSGSPNEAIKKAEHITKIQVKVERSTSASMENRSVAARYDQVSGELTVWDGTQAPLTVRGGLASILEINEDKVRVIAPDVGGGFGQKVVFPYPDELLVPYAAIDLGRPVKYIEDRRENFLGTTHERLQIHNIELYSDKNGKIIALKDFFLHDTGAFIPYGIAIAQVASTSICGPYAIENTEVKFQAVYTPTMTCTPYRGCGRPQACFAIERAIDKLAEELNIDRFEIRRRNLIKDHEFPYKREGLIFADGLPVTLDSGQYLKALEMLHEKMDFKNFSSRKNEAEKNGKLLGLGLAFYVEGTGLGPYEGGHLKIHPITGKIYANTGLTSQGQGHDTVFAQIISDQMGVSVEDVILTEGDSGSFDWGVATFASRAAVVSGNAIHKTAKVLRKKTIIAASNMLEVDPSEIELRDGHAWVSNSNRSVSLAAVATATNPLRYAFNEAAKEATQFAPSSRNDGPPLAEGQHPGLEATDYFSPPASTWAYGVHSVILEVDKLTCSVKILKYALVHDCGNMINPKIVEGQVMGGMAQGLAGALYEKIEYDEDGSLMNANLVDFLVPYATEIPNIEMEHLETPSPINPLGVKGVGEAGTIPVVATIASGLSDACKNFENSDFYQTPITPSMIFDVVSSKM